MKHNVWVKSGRSGNNGACVEVRDRGQVIDLRDSKDQGGPVLIFTAEGWRAFIDGVKATGCCSPPFPSNTEKGLDRLDEDRRIAR